MEPTVRRDDRELLARIARLNKILAGITFPLCDELLTAHDLRTLAEELAALGEEFHHRATLASAVDGFPGDGSS